MSVEVPPAANAASLRSCGTDWTADSETLTRTGSARMVCERIIASGVNSSSNVPSGPDRDSTKRTTSPTTTLGKPIPVEMTEVTTDFP